MLHPQVLGAVRVLVLVDVEVVPAFLVVGEDLGPLLEEPHGLGEQVVEVERGRRAEALGVARVGLRELRLEVAARDLVGLDGADELVLPAADGTEDGGRAQLAGPGELEVAEDLADERGLVVGVVDDEAGVDADRGAVAPQHARAERVERAHRDVAALLADEPEDALAHLGGGLVRERDREDPPRGHAAHADEVGDPVRQHAGLAGARAREDEQRSLGRRDRTRLLGVEARDDGLGTRRRVAADEPRAARAQCIRSGRPCDDREPFGVGAVVGRDLVGRALARDVAGLLPSTASTAFPRPRIGPVRDGRIGLGRVPIDGWRLVGERQERELVGQGLLHRLILGWPADRLAPRRSGPRSMQGTEKRP